MLQTGLFLSLLALPVAAVPAGEIDTKAVDAVFAHWDRPDSPGCALAIVRDGEIVYERGYGVANFEYDVPITPDSVFRIGSTSKQITAACVLLLELDGRLTLDDDVRQYVPELPEYEHTITLRHLMHHTSGLEDYLGLMGEVGIRSDDSCSIEEALELLTDAEVLFVPGEKHQYCNSGYFLLAVVTARVSGMSTREFAHERIFAPLGMNETHFHDDHREIVRNRAVGYGRTKKLGWYRLLTNVNTVGDGGVFSTVRDFFLWDQNFYHRKVGGDALHEALHAPGRLNDGTVLDYASGLVIGKHRGLRVVQHGGAFVGYRAEMIRFPEQRFSVICFANVASFNPTARCFEVADVCLRDEFPAHEQIAMELQGELDRLREESGFPGATFGFVLEDGTGVALATGHKDLDGQRRLRPKDRMLSGSIGKTYVAAYALKLVEMGELELDAPISRWLGEAGWFGRLANGSKITLRQLLSHRSGLPDHVFAPAFTERLRSEPDRVWRLGSSPSARNASRSSTRAGRRYSGRMNAIPSILLASCIGSAAAFGSDGVLPCDEASPPYRVEHCEAVDLTSSVTLEAWVRPGLMERQGGRIIDKGTAGTQSGYLLDTFPANSLRMIVRTDGGEVTVGHPAELAGDRWTHVAGVFDSVRGSMTLYLDGREVASDRCRAGAALVSNRHPLCVGSDHLGRNRFLGEMDRVTVYRRPLTAEEVSALAGDPARATHELAGRVADWDFDGDDSGEYLSSAPGRLALKAPRLHRVPAAKLSGSAPPPEDPRLTPWLRQPAREWLEAFPVGNGRLGGMVHGGVNRERIHLNEDTLWTGGPHCYDNPDALSHLAEVRQRIADGRFKEALAVADRHLIGIPKNQQAYGTLGSLWVELKGHGEAAEYRRELDLARGLVRVNYRIGDATFLREVFVSFPDQVMVVRFTCDRPGRLTGSVLLDSPNPSESVPADDHTLRLFGRMGPHGGGSLLAPFDGEGLEFEARVRVRPEGGEVTAGDGAIDFREADALTLVYTAATSYRSYRDIGGDPGAVCGEHLEAAGKKTYAALRAAHVADHGALFDRVQLDLGGAETARRPVDERIEAVRGGAADPDLVALSFQFGRYLLIASSRPGTQPAHLQGIWADTSPPPWGGKWTLNINAEMNYWPAESCNLAECHEPLLRLVERLREPGRRTAKVHYDCRGFVAHHNADLWLGTAPVDGATWGLWPMGAAWLSRHLWEHYDYSRDRADLERAYPTLKEAAEFFVDYLVEDGEGNLLTTPAISFEQGFEAPDGSQGRLCMGPTMDMQILRDLFTHCIEASRILDVDEELRGKLTAMRARLLPTRVNSETGRLREWRDDREPHSYNTGQLAALWGLNPGDQITPWGTPELAAAARRSLEFRPVHTGSWCSGTRINFWARLGDGEGTLEILRRHLRGHVRPSLLSIFNGDVFQIDGNLGFTAGIAEMLLQSHAGQLNLLPALPEAWPEGQVKGLRARGGFELDLAWTGGTLSRVTLRSRQGGTCTLRHEGRIRELATEKGREYSLGGDLAVIR